uniref:Uncharacterized protein n=1 Tax=Arundo donax TaxID=35708 RepID=A0A0A9GWQ6_ARUDO
MQYSSSALPGAAKPFLISLTTAATAPPSIRAARPSGHPARFARIMTASLRTAAASASLPRSRTSAAASSVRTAPGARAILDRFIPERETW